MPFYWAQEHGKKYLLGTYQASYECADMMTEGVSQHVLMAHCRTIPGM